MSLFASAFETGTTAGPSTSNAGKSSHKRKRPSNAGVIDHKSDDQLRAAQKNLEKLMKSVESGSSDKRDTPRLGRDGINEKERSGVISQKKQKKGLEGDEKRYVAGGLGSSTSPAVKKRKNDVKHTEPPTTHKLSHQGGSTPSVGVTGDKKKKKQKTVEIPLPPSPAKEEDSAGLTSMQKGMKSKLEGARFRWVTLSVSDCLADG